MCLSTVFFVLCLLPQLQAIGNDFGLPECSPQCGFSEDLFKPDASAPLPPCVRYKVVHGHYGKMERNTIGVGGSWNLTFQVNYSSPLPIEIYMVKIHVDGGRKPLVLNRSLVVDGVPDQSRCTFVNHSCLFAWNISELAMGGDVYRMMYQVSKSYWDKTIARSGMIGPYVRAIANNPCKTWYPGLRFRNKTELHFNDGNATAKKGELEFLFEIEKDNNSSENATWGDSVRLSLGGDGVVDFLVVALDENNNTVGNFSSESPNILVTCNHTNDVTVASNDEIKNIDTGKVSLRWQPPSSDQAGTNVTFQVAFTRSCNDSKAYIGQRTKTFNPPSEKQLLTSTSQTTSTFTASHKRTDGKHLSFGWKKVLDVGGFDVKIAKTNAT